MTTCKSNFSLRSLISAVFALGIAGLPVAVEASANRDASRYVDSIDKINAAHARSPSRTTEDELMRKIPQTAVRALDRVLKASPSPETAAALFRCGEAALDLAALEHFERISARLREVDPESAARLGDAVARKRFIVRGIGDFEPRYLEGFADLMSAILDAYDEVFGFKEWSKVPGKKIRIRLHLEEKITRPPHFAPQFPYHSEIDMPVIDPTGLRSPTPQGHMMFYGLCHELGHLIAMWGDRGNMEDHHAWAHYTGVVIVEHMATTKEYESFLADLRDVRWRSLTLERKKTEHQIPPSTKDRAGVMALLIKLHDAAGTKAIGGALNLMSDKGMGHRVNHVRYYRFRDLKRALTHMVEDRQTENVIGEIFP